MSNDWKALPEEISPSRREYSSDFEPCWHFPARPSLKVQGVCTHWLEPWGIRHLDLMLYERSGFRTYRVQSKDLGRVERGLMFLDKYEHERYTANPDLCSREPHQLPL